MKQDTALIITELFKNIALEESLVLSYYNLLFLDREKALGPRHAI
jgi:hypothetical protein